MQRLTTEEFINKAIAQHGGRYDYSLVNYTHSQVKVSIKCETHGVFLQRPSDHLRGFGCKLCGYCQND